MKFLLLLGLFLAVVWLTRGGRRNIPRGAPQPPAPGGRPTAGTTEEMVVCLHCGVHLPESEAVGSAAGWFCSDEHRKLQSQESPR